MPLDAQPVLEQVAQSLVGHVVVVVRVAVVRLQERGGGVELSARAHDASELVGAAERVADVLEDVQRQGGVERAVGEREVLADAEDVGRRVADDLEVHDVVVHRRLEPASRVEDEAIGVVLDDLDRDRVVALIFLPIVFGPIGAVFGFIGYSKGDKAGLWVGIGAILQVYDSQSLLVFLLQPREKPGNTLTYFLPEHRIGLRNLGELFTPSLHSPFGGGPVPVMIDHRVAQDSIEPGHHLFILHTSPSLQSAHKRCL